MKKVLASSSLNGLRGIDNENMQLIKSALTMTGLATDVSIQLLAKTYEHDHLEAKDVMTLI